MDQLAERKLEVQSPVERARSLSNAIAAAADEIEATQEIPEPLLSDIFRLGLFRLLLPRSVEGEEAHPVDYLDALMEVARQDGSVAWNMFVANSATLIAPFLPLETARTIWADPRTVICWGPPNACRLQAVPGGYLVDGEWDFASCSRQATWTGAHAQVVEADGSLRLNEHGRPHTRSVLFPKAEAKFLNRWNPIGLKGTCSDSYRVEGLFVPEAFSGTREAPEIRRDPGPLYAIVMQGLYAVGVAGVALGLAESMLAAFKDLARAKTPRGRGRLADDATTQADFARAEAKLGAGYAYLAAVLNDVYDRADEWAPIGFDDRARLRLACSWAIQGAIEVADWTHRAAGVSAIFPGSPFERRFRDMHTLSQQMQSRLAHFEQVGQVLIGEPPPVFY